MIIQLQPQIRMHTPKGLGYANFLVERGMDFDNEWIVFLDNGEIWSFLNSKVRVENNITYAGIFRTEKCGTNIKKVIWYRMK